MEGLEALLAVPNGRPLEDWIRTDAAVLRAGREALNEVAALLGQVLRLPEEVFEVVLHCRLVPSVAPLTLARVEELHLCCWLPLLLLVAIGGTGESRRGRPKHRATITSTAHLLASSAWLLLPQHVEAINVEDSGVAIIQLARPVLRIPHGVSGLVAAPAFATLVRLICVMSLLLLGRLLGCLRASDLTLLLFATLAAALIAALRGLLSPVTAIWLLAAVVVLLLVALATAVVVLRGTAHVGGNEWRCLFVPSRLLWLRQLRGLALLVGLLGSLGSPQDLRPERLRLRVAGIRALGGSSRLGLCLLLRLPAEARFVLVALALVILAVVVALWLAFLVLV